MKFWIPILLGVNAGYVDTAGYLALQGLFSSHVTGNFVTLSVTFVEGTSGAWVKLMALPMFCLVVMLVRLAGHSLRHFRLGAVRPMLALKVVLLAAAALVIIGHGPFRNADEPLAITSGLLLVSAMAIQNAVQRAHMASLPPTTIMTGNSTQLMLDLADFLSRRGGANRDVVRTRLISLARAVLAFALGCALAAVAVTQTGMWCFALPPVVAIATIWQPLDD